VDAVCSACPTPAAAIRRSSAPDRRS
jgi:hypothetical protein